MSTSEKAGLPEDYVTGIEEIDRQHGNLIDLVGEARRTLHSDSSPARLGAVIRELLSYSIYHFETEERLMRQYGYAQAQPEDAELHIRQHRSFSQQVAKLQEEAAADRQVDTTELIRFLLEWIDRHIRQTDRKLAGFILAERKP